MGHPNTASGDRGGGWAVAVHRWVPQPRLARRWSAVALAFLSLVPGAQASSWQQVTLEELAQASAVVFEGRVTGKAAVRGPGKRRIFTRVTFEVRDTIKGAAPAGVLRLDFLGGTLGDETVSVTDMRLPELGEEGIYFVEATDGRQAHPLYGWDQGRMLIEADLRSGERRVTTGDGKPIYSLTASGRAVAPLGNGPRYAAGLRLAPRAAGEPPLTPEALKETLRSLISDGTPSQ